MLIKLTVYIIYIPTSVTLWVIADQGRTIPGFLSFVCTHLLGVFEGRWDNLYTHTHTNARTRTSVP
jgi:hypothetical protein